MEDEINSRVAAEQYNSSFSLLHLNSRSLISRLFSVIGISETWLNDHTSDQVDIPGYNFISNHRTSKIGGGIGLYLLDYFEYKLLSDCNISDPDTLECLFVAIRNPHGPTQEYMDSLFSHTFFPLITKPTRLTANSATSIDNIFTYYPTQNIFSGIIVNDISDHLPISAHVNSDSVPNKIQEKTFIRDVSVTNYRIIPIESYDTLLGYTRKYLDCFPLKPVQNSKLKILFTPWITKGILTSARKKNRLYKKFMKSHNPTHVLGSISAAPSGPAFLPEKRQLDA